MTEQMSARELTREQIEEFRESLYEHDATVPLCSFEIDALCDMALASLSEPVAMPEPVAWRYRHELGLGTGRWPDEWELCKKEPVERARTFHIQYEPLYAWAERER